MVIGLIARPASRANVRRGPGGNVAHRWGSFSRFPPPSHCSCKRPLRDSRGQPSPANALYGIGENRTRANRTLSPRFSPSARGLFLLQRPAPRPTSVAAQEETTGTDRAPSAVFPLRVTVPSSCEANLLQKMPVARLAITDHVQRGRFNPISPLRVVVFPYCKTWPVSKRPSRPMRN